MKEKLRRWVCFLSLLYVIVGAVLFTFQKNFIYFPTAAYEHGFKDIFLESDGHKIQLIAINDEVATDRALIYFGGNAEAAAYSTPDFAYHFKKTAIFLVNYRGYGLSEGSPSEEANYADATKVYEYVKTRYKNIAVMGRSLGSGMATHLAATQEVSRLVLVTPYDSIESVAQAKFKLYPASLFISQKYLSIERVDKISAPTLVLIAERDNIIPYKHSATLVAAFPVEQIRVEILPGTGHNNISDGPDYFELVRGFVNYD